MNRRSRYAMPAKQIRRTRQICGDRRRSRCRNREMPAPPTPDPLHARVMDACAVSVACVFRILFHTDSKASIQLPRRAITSAFERMDGHHSLTINRQLINGDGERKRGKFKQGAFTHYRTTSS
uniref:Transposase n=1 Tax=Ascaris lumbricoides TaxID=6252 RepID=A0A0M3HPM2_ASCLU